MSKRILYLAAYDVCDPQRLRDALRALKGHASGGQKSVFECFLTDAERAELVSEIKGILELDEDRFLLLPLANADAMRMLGIAVKPEDPVFFYVS